MMYEHWSVEFDNYNKTEKYVAHIYREQAQYEPIVRLQAGSTPFVTQEDAAENVFEPVRGQTATLSIVTESMDLLKELMPRNNTERPIVFAKRGEYEDIVLWCGFLSSESYSQPYNSRLHQVDIHCNSLLASYDSKFYNRLQLSAYCTIAELFYDMYLGVNNQVWGKMPLYIPADSENILTKYIMPGFMYDSEIVVEDNGISVSVQTISAKKILSNICQLMGWQLREWNGALLFYKFDYEGAYHIYDIESMVNQQGHLTPVGTVSTEQIDMSDFNWHSTEHQRTTIQGAKKVKVSANVEPFDMVLSLYDTEYANLCDDRVPTNMPPYTDTYAWHFYYPNNIENNLVLCRQEKILPKFKSGEPMYETTSGNPTFDDLRSDLYGEGSAHAWQDTQTIIPKPGVYNDFRCRYVNESLHRASTTGDGQSITIGAMKCRLVQQYGSQWYRYTSGLFLLGCNIYSWPPYNTLDDKFRLLNVNPVFVQESEKPIHIKGGYLKLSMKQYEHNFADATGRTPEDDNLKLASAFYISVMVGNQSWRGWWYGQSTGWEADNIQKPVGVVSVMFDKDKNLQTTAKPIYEESDGYYIPVPEDVALDGVVRVFLYPMMVTATVKENPTSHALTYTPVNTPFITDRAIFEDISLEYIPPKQYKSLTDKGENEYARNLNKAYMEDMDIECELGTDRDNKYSERILRLNDKYPLTQLVYRKNGHPVGMRPEANLLKRAATYYAKNRDIVDIIITDDVSGPKKISGCFGETFAPLAIETDWRSGERKVKCFDYDTEDNSGYDSNYRDPTSSDRYDTDPQERDKDYEENYDAPDYDGGDGVDGPWGGDPEGGPGHGYDD